jgi:hypothetical protein
MWRRGQGLLLLSAAIVVAAAGGVVAFLKLRTDPVREMIAKALPAWQSERSRGGGAGGEAARDLVARATRWPELAAAFTTLDEVWPDADQFRDAAKTANRALAAAALPYFVDVQRVGRTPVALSYELVTRVAWRIGERTVDVLRLRRLDALNVELAMYGATDEGLPVVLLDRIESTLAEELPEMYGHEPEGGSRLNAFDRVALARQRAFLDARLGAGLAAAVGDLVQRNKLLAEMRLNFARADITLYPPDGFVLGEPWLSRLERFTELGRRGGPVVLESDLRRLGRADDKLRSGAAATMLAAAVDLMSQSTEAHEARHALDEEDPVGSPPPALFAEMQDNTSKFIGMADREMRAYLGELHDAASPPCVSLAKMLRGVHGRAARRTPHFYATVTIMRALDPDDDSEPAVRLAMLCELPEPELRRRVASTWQKLYGTPLPAGKPKEPT